MDASLATLFDDPHQQPANLSQATALLWVAAAQGDLGEPTQALTVDYLNALPPARQHLDWLLKAVDRQEEPTLLLACKTLRSQLAVHERRRLLERAVALARAEAQLSTAANHLLRFLSVLLEPPGDVLFAIYRQCCGEELPEPGDPGAILWWELEAERRRGSRDPVIRSRREALTILGLDHDASHAEIKRVYRRLVQSCHPDRFEALGPTARADAERRFLRVQRAYEVLRR